MTSAPEGKPGRRPPTIELTATEVESSAPPAQADGEAPRQDASTPQAAPGNGGFAGRIKAHALSGLIGAVAMAALIAALWLGDFVLSRQVAAPVAEAPSTVAPGNGPDIAARLDKIETTIEAQRPEAVLANRVIAAEVQTKSLGDSLAALSRRVDDIAATSQSAAKQADAAQAAAESPKSDIEALSRRIAALEETVAALSASAAHPAAAADDHAVRLTVAAEALRAAVDGGIPYQAELAALRSLGVDPSAAAALEPFATTGVPSVAALARDLAGLLPALQRASDATSGETSFLGRLEANAQHLVRVTPVDAPAGTDPAAVVARIGADAAHADIAAALTDIAALPQSTRPLAADWVTTAKAREAAIAASRQITAAALAALVKPAAQ